MEDKIRNRNLGEIYTPDKVSDLLFVLSKKHLGENFNKEHVVWDCCWGTGNLTNGKEFDNLFVSTLRGIDIRKNRNKNKDAKKFVYDFLNDDTEQLVSKQAMWMGSYKIEESLLDYLEDESDNRELTFYINPPYVSTGIFGSIDNGFRDGAADNNMKQTMKNENFRSATDQTYCQFLYRIKLMQRAYNKKVNIAIICPPQFLTKGTMRKFRENLSSRFKFEGGALFRASHFKGLSDGWGISIQLWTTGETENTTEFKIDLYDDVNGKFIKIGEKTIYNLDNYTKGSDYIKDTVGQVSHVHLKWAQTSGCKLVKNGHTHDKKINTARDALGYLFFKGNSVYHNNQECGVMTLGYCGGGGVSITRDNIDEVITFFAARKLFDRYGANWINDKDEYCIPNKNSSYYKKLRANSRIFVNFNLSSHQTSIKSVDGIKYPNMLFFMSKDEMDALAKTYGVELIDIGNTNERLMKNLIDDALESGLVTKKGVDVLIMAKQLIEKSIECREEFNKQNMEYQVMHWDAGWYQIKQLVKKYYPEEFTKFNKLYREFCDEIRDLVYDSGYLKHKEVIYTKEKALDTKEVI